MSAHTARVALAVLRTCPFCYGLGHEDDGRPCLHCEGLGNYLRAIERRCYRAGRDDALEQARYGVRQLGKILEQPVPPGASELRG